MATTGGGPRWWPPHGFDGQTSARSSSPPGEVARQAVENDAHIIGMSTKDPGQKTLLPELVKENRLRR
uniref:Methylmalonyl-CoA mutase C-terminal domain-containing protein n=1 Tax=Candidatus Kentrum sp. LPFa TaxID=2126335 RepID=A0A450WGB5_9GAMM|nr:MAG: methylmalonyl-CoA mutase C-terminal domain-containing protein [Candidatus Kentron sp. LPFa]VFK31822.1 MAG: methylmalonyl-CoA mutase C-terminal domain-containing protein [Candidatus Kentron sp. LPFa]